MPELSPNPFTYINPDEESLSYLDALTEQFQKTYDEMLRVMPDCRERSMAITKLQECGMWSNAGVVFTQVRFRPSPVLGEFQGRES